MTESKLIALVTHIDARIEARIAEGSSGPRGAEAREAKRETLWALLEELGIK